MTNRIIIRTDLSLGTWQGLGGAITEATAYNFARLGPDKKRKLLEAYYGKNGLDYRWGRVSIGSNDFCLEPYEYTKRADFKDFSIDHDKIWVLPMLKQVLKEKDLKLIASPWSPPRCLKIALKGRKSGVLKPWRYSAYTDYLRKWLKAYESEGVKIDYLTPQNEPFARQIWESCFYPYFLQRRLAYKYLARELKNTGIKLLLWDHNKGELEKTADKLLRNGGFDKTIAGLCFHWYDGVFPSQMWRVRQKYPDVLMVSSEMSCGFSPYDEKKWQKDANLYLKELFSDINSGADAFIDWNMLLDYRGGPTYCGNFLKSPIILNENGDDFILTPIYKVLKKFTKLFPVGSEVIRLEYNSKDIVAVARKTKTGYKIIVANLSEEDLEVTIKLGGKTKMVTVMKSNITKIDYKSLG